MKFISTCFFIILTGIAICTLQGCGKKSMPQSACDPETYPQSYGS